MRGGGRGSSASGEDTPRACKGSEKQAPSQAQGPPRRRIGPVATQKEPWEFAKGDAQLQRSRSEFGVDSSVAALEAKSESLGMQSTALPSRTVMLRAFQGRDASFEGVFLTAVLTTGIFCRPTCPARKPNPKNVEFFGEVGDALRAGYRPCRRCRPLEVAGAPPDWLRPLLDEVEADPQRRWRDQDLRELGLEPTRVRRWFRAEHGMTFHAYARARRLGLACAAIRSGDRVTEAAFSHGYDSLSGFGAAIKKLLGEPPKRSAAKRTPVVLRRITSPLGTLLAGATESGVCLLEFSDRRQLETQLRSLQARLGAVFAPGTTPHLETLEAELADYFAGARTQFEVPLHAPGTPFQEQVWAGLRAIPAGETRSYSALAEALGRPTAVRAVARANGDNRIAILIPCHRVIGRDGRLTGYGGGLWRKRRLLQLEGAAVEGV